MPLFCVQRCREAHCKRSKIRRDLFTVEHNTAGVQRMEITEPETEVGGFFFFLFFFFVFLWVSQMYGEIVC